MKPAVLAKKEKTIGPKPAPQVDAGRPARLLTEQINDMSDQLKVMKKSNDLRFVHITAQNEIKRRLDVVEADLQGIKTLLRR